MKILGSQFPTADDFRFHQYDHKNVVDYNNKRLTPTSTYMLNYTLNQCHQWKYAMSAEDKLDPLEYGYIENDGELEPQITSCSKLPQDLIPRVFIS